MTTAFSILRYVCIHVVMYTLTDVFTRVYGSRYRFSLRMFTSLFVEALSLQTETTSTELRIKLLKNRLQSLVFSSVSRSLFKDDRLMFALHLAHGMHPEQFEDGEWEFFVGAAHKGIARVRFSSQALHFFFISSSFFFIFLHFVLFIFFFFSLLPYLFGSLN